MAYTRSNFISLTLLLFFTLLDITESLDISYCSPENTGSDNGPNYWQFQSNGHCQDTCKAQFAYAILQGSNCWCSNYAPYEQTDTGSCNMNCPGFLTDKCGNQAQALYGYYHLTIQPSGTVGAPSPTYIPTSTVAGPTTVTATVLATITNSRIPKTSVFIPSSAAATSPASTTQATTTSTPTSTPTSTFRPTPITIVTTASGSVRTVTVTPTPTQPSSAADTGVTATQAPDPFWSDSGKVAGTFTALALVILALLMGLGYMFWRKRRSSDSVAIRSVSDHDGHSTTGTFFGTNAEKRHSRQGLNTPGAAAAHDRTPTLATPMSMSRRASQPLVHDQRLNPSALYAMGQDNGSHVSVGSFQDDRDYSRPVLHIRNPDSA